MEEIKKNYLSKTGNIPNLELYDNNDCIVSGELVEKDIPDYTSQDFSIINDEFIEKFSKI